MSILLILNVHTLIVSRVNIGTLLMAENAFEKATVAVVGKLRIEVSID